MKKVRLFNRQVALLSLLEGLGGHVDNRDFQKLLFLYCREIEESPPYEFVPYKYGAFSFSSYADRRKLIQTGLIADNDESWHLTNEGKIALDEKLGFSERLPILDFAKRYRRLRGIPLVAETYRRFPFHATQSEIVDKVLANDPLSLRRIKDAKPKRQIPLSTIGYEGLSLESYLNKLLCAGVTLLCDVRKNAISRKYGFSKTTLSKGCVGVGIRYEHLCELGIVSHKRKKLQTQADYDDLLDEYEREVLTDKRQEIQKIKSWVESGERVALTCYEKLPVQCHRSCVARAVSRQLDRRVTAIDL